MNIIVAVDEKFGIGKDGNLLTRIPEDMKSFRNKTLNKVVVMGHHTFLTLPGSKGLKDRTNIVLSRDKELSCPDAAVCHSLKDFSSIAKDYDTNDIFIIGGQNIYEQFLTYCEYAYITKLQAVFDADKFFPNIDNMKEWICVEENAEVWGDEVKARLYKYKNTQYENLFD